MKIEGRAENTFQKIKHLLGFAALIFTISGCDHKVTHLIDHPEPPVKENLGQPEDKVELDLAKGVPVHFIENVGVGNPSEKFHANNLGTAAMSFTNEGFTIAVSEEGGAPAAILDMHYDKAGPATTIKGISPAEALTHSFLGSVAEDWKSNLVNFSGIEYSELYDGVKLRYKANGRVLHSVYTVSSPMEIKKIKWIYTGLNWVKKNKETGILSFSINSGARQRTFSLGRLIANQRGRKIEVDFDIDEDVFGFSLGRYNPGHPITITYELMYSEHFDDYDARKSLNGTVYVAGSTVSYESIRNRDIDKDVFVAKLDSSGSRVLSTTILGGAKNDIAHGITLSDEGDIYIVGKTNSINFPVVEPMQKTLGGAYDAFLLKLGKSGKKLHASTYFGGAGIDAIDSVYINNNNTVILAGKAGRGFPFLETTMLSYTTVFPEALMNEKEQSYFLAFSSLSLKEIKAVNYFKAPDLKRPVVIWSDRFENPVIGIRCAAVKSGACDYQKSYQMDLMHPNLTIDADPHVNYTVPHTPPLSALETGWGYHALRWKKMHTELTTSAIAYDPHSVSNSVPLAGVSCGDESLVNAAELVAFTPPDPAGIWQCNFHNSVEGLALGAAYYMDRWGSPVYTNAIRYDSALPKYYEIAVEKVTYCVVDPLGEFDNTPNSSHQLPNLCSFSTIPSASALTANCANPSAYSFFYEVKEFDVSVWALPLVWHLYPVKLGKNASGFFDWYVQSDYIGDPPEEEAGITHLFEDATKQLRRRFVTRTNLVGKAYRAGRVSHPVKFDCYARKVDF